MTIIAANHDAGRDLPTGVKADPVDSRPADADPADAWPADGTLGGTGVPGAGLSWSWDLDLEALVTALSDHQPWSRDLGPAASQAATGSGAPSVSAEPDVSALTPDPVEAEFAEYLDAVEAGRSTVIPLPAVAGRVAECAPVGAELAGWLSTGTAAGLEDRALAGMAASWRRLASWAQAGELAMVAELTSRSAATDDRIGVDESGRPARVPEDACAEVSLALTMSQCSASWWTDLAVTLRWRLAATGAALRAGTIDLGRARAIADATAMLDDETARAVQDRVLPRAGEQTMGQLRASLRRAVIVADPEGAERRREEAERQAKVTLYPDTEGTASLAGYSLPGVQATAAMARITALARALKASGANSGIDLLRAQVFLGLLLGTLPYIPPAPDLPPDDGPTSDDPQDEYPPGDHPRDEEPTSDDPQDLPRTCLLADHSAADGEPDETVTDARPPPWPRVPAFVQPGPAAMGNLAPVGGGLLHLRLSWGTLTGESSEPGYLGRLGPITPAQAAGLADLASLDPTVRWRVIVTNSDGQAVAVKRIRHQESQGRVGLVGDVTVVMSHDWLTDPPVAPDLPPVARRLLAAAGPTAATSVDGGCAHAEATTAYRPSRRLWEHVTARDVTCRFLTCRQPAWRCDLDHTTPFDQGGRTCACNLGGLCRFHHKIKQHPRWGLRQPAAGTFIWTTPTGRQYIARPDSHAA